MASRDGSTDREVRITTGASAINGDLSIPSKARGLVIFAHGSGSSRFSPRNRLVAGELRTSRFATLLMDLLTPEEEAADQVTGQFRFDIDVLTERLVRATDWALADPATAGLAIGYFGASTGAAAAIDAAAQRPRAVKAIVSRGGRVDLADTSAIRALTAPTLLIVGERDAFVLSANRKTRRELHGENDLSVVQGATHLFEEPGTLERVAELAAKWFERYLARC